MTRKTRARKAPAQSTSKKDDTATGLNESEDEITQTPESKKLKMTTSPSFMTPDCESRYKAMDLGSQAFTPAQPISSKLVPLLTQCGDIKIFQDVGLESFFLEMPKVYYPDLIREYYANLGTDKFGSVISKVRGKKIQLNSYIFSSILKI